VTAGFGNGVEVERKGKIENCHDSQHNNKKMQESRKRVETEKRSLAVVVRSKQVNVSVEVTVKNGGKKEELKTQVHFDWTEGRRTDREECVVEVHTDEGLVHFVKGHTNVEGSAMSKENSGENDEGVEETLEESREEITESESEVLENLNTEAEKSEEEQGCRKSTEDRESRCSDVQDRDVGATTESASQAGKWMTIQRKSRWRGRWCNGSGRGERMNIPGDYRASNASMSRRTAEWWTSSDAGNSPKEDERKWRSTSMPLVKQWWKNTPRMPTGTGTSGGMNKRGNYGRRGALRGWR